MTVGYEDFVADYPEFQDQGRFPESAVSYWVAIGYLMLTQTAYGTSFWDTTPGTYTPPGASGPRSLQDHGIELFIAHNLALEVQASDASSVNATPGTVGGTISGRTVNGLTINYDPASGLEKDAGHWGLTIYGRRFLRLARLVGAVPLQIGIGCDPTGGMNGPGWAGPPPWLPGSPGSGIY